MVTEHATAPAASAASEPDQNSRVCYFKGGYVALGEARIPIMTHAFLYGTAVFEGIRAYWNPDEKQLYALRVKEHIVRLRNSSKIMLMAELPSVAEFTEIVLQVLRRNEFQEDAYCRPSVYKSTEAIGVKLHGLTHDFYVLAIPMGDYIDTEKGISTGTVSWRRTSDVSMPSRSKITGSYVNPAFSKTEAMLNGFEEAIVLTAEGHVAEGSAENLFMVRDGVLITPAVSEDILEGITRAGIIEIAAPDRSQRAVHRRRGLPLRHGRAGLACRIGRPSRGRRRPGRAALEADQQDLFRRGAGAPAGVPALGDARLYG
jgi:branched-chain amino acid aminotransferase